MIRVEHHDIDGAVGFVELAGEGDPVLCIHTAGQSGIQWREVLREMPAHGYRVIVPDLPGHGRSDNAVDGPIVDLGRYADWLVQLLDRLDVRRPYIVGCSIGGKIALELAASPSVAARGVVAMAAEAHNGRLSVSGLERSLEDAASPSRSDRTFYGTIASFGSRMPGDRALRRAALHRREDPAVSTSDLIGWTTHDVREHLDRIACPVHLVAGVDDFWIDPADVAWTAARIGGARYDLLDGVGHYPMEEIPEFPRVLAGWLRALSVQTGADR